MESAYIPRQKDFIEYICSNGKTYMIPPKSCLVCKYCPGVFCDYTNGPYMVFCNKYGDVNNELGLKGKCKDFVGEDVK